MPLTIFISYRREDSAGHAGRLFDRLREHFGKDHVFLDVVGIEAGVDFVETIDQAVGSCDVLLAVIGREWLTCCDKKNRRRLDDPNDFIRTEISSALKRNVRVVPVLVEGAEMPPTDALPEDLQRLTRRQAVELRDSRWDSDVEALIAALERDAGRTGAGLPKLAPPPVPSGPVEPEAERKPGRKALLWGIGLVALLAVVGVAVFLWAPWKQERLDGGPQASATPDGGSQGSETPTKPTEPPEPERTPETPPPDDRPPEPQTVKTPDLVGLSLQAATDQIRAAGLVVGDQESKQTAEAPARQVLSQWPRPGKELDRGSPVDLVYAEPLPDSRIAVPDVVGAQYREALKTLQDAGFEVIRRTEPSPAAENTVVRQEPASGSRVEKGARITLTYAVPVITGIEVPDVVGMDLRKAMAILQKAGLDLARKPEPSKAAQHTVLRQEPPPGKRVEKGTQITLVYAIPIEDRLPDGIDRTIVYIWYNDETERTTAEKLAIDLRGLQLPGTVFRVGLAKRGPLPGKLFYASRSTQAKLASTIARRSGDFLSQVTGREVRIQMVLDPDVAESGLILTLPKL